MFKKLKNCTFTQTHLDLNGGVGIFLGLTISKLWPQTLIFDWYLYIVFASIISIPIWTVIAKQFSNNLSLNQKSLSDSYIRKWE